MASLGFLFYKLGFSTFITATKMTAVNTGVLYSQNWHRRGIGSAFFFLRVSNIVDLDQGHFLKMRRCSNSSTVSGQSSASVHLFV